MLQFVLVLPGIALNFFTVASRGLWFGFVLEAVPLHRDVSVTGEQLLHSSEDFSPPNPTAPVRGLGVH